MKTRLPVVRKTAVAAFSLLLVVFLSPDLRRSGRAAHAAPATAMTMNVPADFLENRGQWDASVKFFARSGVTAAAFERDAIRLRFGKEQQTSLSLVFEGASRRATLAGEARRETRYNFFVGNDPARWRSNVAAYGGVVYRGLYEGVDVRVREAEERFEYDLLLAAGADLARVVMRAEGASRLEVAGDGSLLVHTERRVSRPPPGRCALPPTALTASS